MPKQGDVDQSYPVLLETENKIKLLEPFKGTKVHHDMECLVCGHIWSATPLSKRQTYKKYGVGGCPECNKTAKQQINNKTRDAHAMHLRERGIIVLDPTLLQRTTTKKIWFKNIHCGHEFEAHPGNVIQRGMACTVCGIKNRTANATKWSKANSAKWQETATEWQKYKSIVEKLTRQTYTQYKKEINPHNLPRGKAGEEGAYHLDHRVPKRFCFDNNIPPEVCASKENLQMIGWRENVGSRNHIKGSVPPSFFKYLVNAGNLAEYTRLLHTVFPKGQLFVPIGETVATVYDESANIAVVVLPLDRQYGNLKTALHSKRSMDELGIRLIQIFEDEFRSFDLLKRKLEHYTHTNTATRLHTRQLVIREAEKSEKKELLDRNHTQGNDNAQVNIGAYYGDTLVAVMTFSHPRVALGQKGKKDRTGVWELSRFCTDVDYRIPGVASRLLKHFQRNWEWSEIYSYADKRWSVGGMYEALGFKLVADNPPDYFYVVDGVRKHRWNYRKDVLKNTLPGYDPTKTEYDNMVAAGYWRVWDCGTLKYSIVC
jgi:hypothetical protein